MGIRNGTLAFDNATWSGTADVRVGDNAGATSTLSILNGSVFTTAGCFVVGNCNNTSSTLIVSNSTVNVCGKDLELGTVGNTGTQSWAIITCSTMNIAQDINLQSGGSEGTLILTGACTTVNVASALSAPRACGTSAWVEINNCATLIASNDCTQGGGAMPATYGGCCQPATIKITNGGVLTQNAGTKSCVITTGNQTEIIIDGGTHNGTSQLRFECGAKMRGDNTHCTPGVWANPIELRGGTFNDCTAAGDILVLQSTGTDAITQQGVNDEFVMNGLGTIRLGSDDLIDNSADTIDIDINGGVLDMNGTTQGASGATLGSMTLTNTSTIEFTPATSSQNLFLKDISWGGTLNIVDWSGTPGNNGTGGRLLIKASSSSLTVGDNSGSGFTGINWNGGTYSLYEVLSVDIGGVTFHEIVPFGAVPEPSTWLGGASLLALALWDFQKRHIRKQRASIRSH